MWQIRLTTFSWSEIKLNHTFNYFTIPNITQSQIQLITSVSNIAYHSILNITQYSISNIAHYTISHITTFPQSLTKHINQSQI